ncbi:hypothetical protein [Pararobbsia alpina]|uniref:HTH psq-type domain-containing protein n=1 Tax=Pararobbsia alpina TaxID=621374 RepID=A0A6S7BB29_9BURK|nr:hypothetical protein [Pararobbsia alpina]CAB3784153.1 hypothetical protein LMG28138_01750 [Pararobbsia alpina]
MSKTQDALKWLSENPDRTVYAAAKEFKVASSTLYKAIKQRDVTQDQRCPCCGQLIREGKQDGS